MIDKAKIHQFFNPFQEVSIAPLIVFRIIFGALMLIGTSRFILNGWVQKLYIEPTFFFPFLGFEWVKPLPGNWMFLPFVLLFVSALFFMFGFFYRIASVVLFLSFTYIELLDKTNYLNHYYFVSLVAFLMLFLPANRYCSLDAQLNLTPKQLLVSKWNIGILKFQLGIVYVFAGIAKLNSDWLFDANPLRIWLQAHHHLPLVGKLLQQEWVAFAFSWTGCIYDLFIVIFLFNKHTRPFAYVFVVIFHLVTWYLFPIGVFPWVMIFSTLIFFSPNFHERILQFITKEKMQILSQKMLPTFNKKIVSSALILFVSFQILVPFRYLAYNGDLFWHEQGFRFSWRVMLMHKEGYGRFFVVDSKTKREMELPQQQFLTPIQLDQMLTQPDMILQYAQILYKEYNGKTFYVAGLPLKIHKPEIQAEIYVTLNGRPSQLFVRKGKNLVTIKNDLKNRTWLEDFKK